MHKENARNGGAACDLSGAALRQFFAFCTAIFLSVMATSASAERRANNFSLPDNAPLAASLEARSQLTRYAEIRPGQTIGYIVRLRAAGDYAARATSISGSGRYQITITNAANHRVCEARSPDYTSSCTWRASAPGEYRIWIQHRGPLRAMAALWVGPADAAAPNPFD